jgi:hypothetical protein
MELNAVLNGFARARLHLLPHEVARCMPGYRNIVKELVVHMVSRHHIDS